MNWGYDEFANSYELLLNNTGHYIFLSSCRVFDDQQNITEESPRLLDTTNDEDFLKTQRYALRKAREEDLLTFSGYSNFTIVRPYITFSSTRMQLGIYEKEQWLSRALNNKVVYITKGVLNKKTTLTYGKDVAEVMARLVEIPPLTSSINISTSQSVKWSDIFNIYKKVLKEVLDIDFVVKESDDLNSIEMLYEGGYNTKYDRLWNRTFDNQKVKILFPEKSIFVDTLYALEKCIRQCLVEKIDVVYDTEFNSKMDEYENRGN